MAFDVHWVDDRVEITYFGRVDARDVRATDSAVIGSFRFDKVRAIIVDISRVTALELTPQHAVENAYVDNVARLIKPDCRLAYVIGDETTRQHVRIHNQTLRNLGFPWVIEHFESRADAIAWLSAAQLKSA
jgi:hypothetical protein